MYLLSLWHDCVGVMVIVTFVLSLCDGVKISLLFCLYVMGLRSVFCFVFM